LNTEAKRIGTLLNALEEMNLRNLISMERDKYSIYQSITLSSTEQSNLGRRKKKVEPFL